LRTDGWQVLGIDLKADDHTVAADVTHEQDLVRAAQEFGDAPIDALVCAAGVWLAGDDRYTKVDLDAWNTTLAVNVTGTMLTMRVFAPRISAGGAVVTVGSMAALAGIPRRDAYTASKGAIVALTRAWAADLIRFGVRVNCIAPGQVATPMTERVSGLDVNLLPLGREAEPDEIVEVIVSLINPASGYLNGAVIPIDGGLTAASALAPLSPRK
jgi:3-oxoacyl-[acyl-carrier protein] reductase